MWGAALHMWAQSVEQETSGRLHSDSVEFYKTSHTKATRFPLKSGLYLRIYAAVVTVATILLLIALAWNCVSSSIRQSISGRGRRRLASGGGRQGEEDDEETRQACEKLEEILAAERGEDLVSNPPPPPPTGPSVEGAADKERPRKRKKKTKRHAEGTEERSEHRAKMPKVKHEEIDSYLDLDPEELATLLFPPLKESTSSSWQSPPLSHESYEHSGLDTLEDQIIKGQSTLVQWILDSEDDVPLTHEEQRMPQGSADSSPLEGTSYHFIYDPSTHPVDSGDPSKPSGDAEMPSTSGGASDVQAPSSQGRSHRVRKRSHTPQSGSLLESSATPPKRGALTPFDPSRFRRGPTVGSFPDLLKPLEILLRKKSHGEEELKAIIFHSQKVYGYAKQRLCKLPEQRKPSELLRMLVLRFLAIHALWRACNVVGFSMRKNEWWQKLISTVYFDLGWWRPNVVHVSHNSKLLEMMIDMMEHFKRDVAPPEDQITILIKEVFDAETGISILKGSEWNLWREGGEDS